MIDWSGMRKKRKPTRRERASYRRWVKHLSGGKLSWETIHMRAGQFVEQRKEPPKK